jgi:SPP1 gp7 family putative phage head morphogenesis protein
MSDLNKLASDIADRVICEHCEREAKSAIADAVLKGLGLKRRRRTVKPNWAARDRFLAPYEKRFKSLLKGIWKDEKRTVLANMKRTPLPKGLTAAAPCRKDSSFIDQWLYPESLYKGKLTAAGNRLLGNLTSATVQRVIEQWSLDVSFSVVNESALTWLSGYTPQLAQVVEAETLTTLRTQLMQGIEAGENMDKLTARVRDTFDDMEKWRAERIARSETITAQERGNREVYKEAGFDQKVWMANPDACDDCLALDGVVVGMDDQFFHDSYSDGQTPPLHPNCRCDHGPYFD